MKKILSILLALSIACGSVMLTSCGDDAKEDDDDKSVSDKERDEDEDDESSDDEEDESSEDEDKSSSDDDDESSEDEENESSEDDDDESSEDEEDESSEDDEDNGGNTASGTVQIGEISFVLPEDIEFEIADNYVSYETDNVTFTVEAIGEIDSVDNYSEEFFEESFGYIGTLEDTVYEVSTLDGCDTIYYSTTLVASDEELGIEIDMYLIAYMIFTEEDSYGLVAMSYGNGDIDFVNDAINSMEIN